MAESLFSSSLGQSDPQEIEYQSVEPWAVGGLLLGILSAVALFGSLLWLVPALGIAANVVALARLRRDAGRPGRAAALVGLGLSVLFGVAPAAQSASSFVMLSRQAREVADQYLQYLREESPEKALMLRFGPDQRQPRDELLWTYFRNDKEARSDLLAFVNQPVIRTLLALGPRAEIRFYKTAAVAAEGTRGLVNYIYTVTYSDNPADGDPTQGGKKTFFINVTMERNPTQAPDINPWRVTDTQGGFDPDNPAR